MSRKQEPICKVLHLLKRRYDSVANGKNTRNTPLKLELLSKLALLELGGWIEMTIDKILEDYVSRKISDAQEQVSIRQSVIMSVFGFDPHRHVWPLFERILGVENCRRLKMDLEQKRLLHPFQSYLRNLWEQRSQEAHTYRIGVTHSVNTPSWTLSRFFQISPIIEQIRKFVERL